MACLSQEYPHTDIGFHTVPKEYERLKEIFREMGSVLVAYSGGVDSTFLLKVAHDELGDRAIGVIACSETYPSDEIQAAEELAHAIGVRVIKIHTDELRNEAFVQNTPDRCYYCKTELFNKLNQIAAQEGLNCVIHGGNIDDFDDYRPGQKAAEELGVRAPLQEAGLAKAKIRELSKQAGLPTWDKPSFACLSSRFPYGTPITSDALTQIDKAEKLLRSLGFRQVRVRHHGTIARIETELDEAPRLLDPSLRDKIVGGFKELGYLYVTVDIEGYRTGSMNVPLGRTS